MRIGIPKETKIMEGRVALVPDACGELVRSGHSVWVETGAGVAAGYADSDYEQVGCSLALSASLLYENSELIIKVKEPVAGDLEYLRAEHTVFSYLHLAANPDLLEQLKQIGLTAIAFETVEDTSGQLPLLAPMSQIAGRLSIQTGSHLLSSPAGGKGVLPGGVAGAGRGNVVIVGGGHAGGSAAELAAAIGANVTVFDISSDRLDELRRIGPNVTTLYPHPHALERVLREADLLVGAVLVTGQRAPHVVEADMMAAMSKGSVVIDIAIDQGGCIETTRPTDYENPVYVLDDVVYCNVTNMPGAVPRTASQALSAALLPCARRLADAGSDLAGLSDGMKAGINVRAGKAVYPGL